MYSYYIAKTVFTQIIGLLLKGIGLHTAEPYSLIDFHRSYVCIRYPQQ